MVAWVRKIIALWEAATPELRAQALLSAAARRLADKQALLEKGQQEVARLEAEVRALQLEKEAADKPA